MHRIDRAAECRPGHSLPEGSGYTCGTTDRTGPVCVRDGHEVPCEARALARGSSRSHHSRMHRSGQQFLRAGSSAFFVQWKEIFSFVNFEYLSFPFNDAALFYK